MANTIPKFNTDADGIAYFDKILGKHDYAVGMVGKDNVIFCGTCLVYEDELWGRCNNMLDSGEYEDMLMETMIEQTTNLLAAQLGVEFEVDTSKLTEDHLDDCREVLANVEDDSIYASSLMRDLAIKVFDELSGYRIVDVSNSY